jgi:CBS domain-containing protein
MTVQAYADELTTTPARHRALPVVGWDGAIVGVVTMDRLARVPVGQRASVRVQDVALPMTMVGTASPDERLLAAASRFGLGELGVLLVFDAGRLAGIVTAADVRHRARAAAAAAVL